MRLILHHDHFRIDQKAALVVPPDTFAFYCFEDFSVGPLGDWKDHAGFMESRAEFWQKTELLTLPDGSQMDYFFWYQTLPRFDLVKIVQSGISAEDIPLPHELHDLISAAKSIEIWRDATVHGQVFLWYVVAALQDFQIDSSRVSVCMLREHFREKQSLVFWSDMLSDRPNHAFFRNRFLKESRRRFCNTGMLLRGYLNPLIQPCRDVPKNRREMPLQCCPNGTQTKSLD